MKLIRAFLKLILSVMLCAGVLSAVGVLFPRTFHYAAKTLYSLPFAEDFISALSCSSDSGSVTDTLFATEDTASAEYTFDAEFYPYYSLLDSQEQKAYSAIYEGILSCEDVISFNIDGLTPEQFTSAWESVLNDHPELFWATGECSYTKNGLGTVVEAEMTYCVFAEGQSEAAERFSAAAASILNNAAVLGTDYEKEIYIHDALAEMIDYDLESDHNQSAYSALVSGSSVCAGYARAYQYLLMQCGIPCYYCTGTCGENGETDHAWNIVVLDGEYYYVDLTWDDASGSYAFFNRNESDYAATHRRTGLSVFLPSCSGEAYHNTAAMPADHTPDFGRHNSGGIQGELPGIPGPGSQNGSFGIPGTAPGSMPGGPAMSGPGQRH